MDARVTRRIYPSARALTLATAGLAASLAIGLLMPTRWPLGLLCALAPALAALADFALLLRAPASVAGIEAPAALGQGEAGAAAVRLGPAPARLQGVLLVGERLAASPPRQAARDGVLRFALSGLTRGVGLLEGLQLRWPGPLGLLWRQLDWPLHRDVLVTPDLGPARAASRALQDRAPAGAKVDVRIGEGAEFRALRAFVPGDDRRVIDWKRSAARRTLLAKEYQLEQNHLMVLALDTGRQMAEPLGGRSRLDRALAAALALGWAALSTGDRVRLMGFDARVGVDTPPVADRRGFATLQAAAARLECAPEATNYTLALHQLAGSLKRRALVVVFTEFTDTVGAELMLESAAGLVRRHTVLFVAFRDAELDALIAAPPQVPEDISRAVVAAGLKRERALVLERLRRMGVRTVETTPERMGGAVIDAYLDLKRRELG